MGFLAAYRRRNRNGLVKWRLPTQFEVDCHIPTRIDVTPNGGGEHDERSVLERTIEADRLYVMDRGNAKFTLFNKIVHADSSYVCRLRGNSVFVVTEGRPFSDADRAAGLFSDQLVGIGLSSKKESRLDHQIRLACVKCSPLHQPRKIPRRHHRRRQRRDSAHRHEPAGRPCRDHRLALLQEMDR